MDIKNATVEDNIIKEIFSIFEQLDKWLEKKHKIKVASTREATEDEIKLWTELENKSDNAGLQKLRNKGFFKNCGKIKKKIYITEYKELGFAISLLERLRYLITNESIVYVATNQKESDEIGKLFKSFRDKLTIGTDEMLFLGVKNKNKKAEAEFRNIKSKIEKNISVLKKQQKMGEEIDKMEGLKSELLKKLENYDMLLSENGRGAGFLTFYVPGEEKENKKDFIEKIKKQRKEEERPMPVMIYNAYRERFQQWAFEPVKDGSEIIQMIGRQYFYVEPQDFDPSKKYTFYTTNGYSLKGSEGIVFEAYLRGSQGYRVDIDNVFEESKGQTPFFQGPDLYNSISGLSMAIQAKARGSSIKGDTAYNEISTLVKGFKLLKTTDQFYNFFCQNFFETDYNKGKGVEGEKIIEDFKDFAAPRIEGYISKRIEDISEKISKKISDRISPNLTL